MTLNPDSISPSMAFSNPIDTDSQLISLDTLDTSLVFSDPVLLDSQVTDNQIEQWTQTSSTILLDDRSLVTQPLENSGTSESDCLLGENSNECLVGSHRDTLLSSTNVEAGQVSQTSLTNSTDELLSSSTSIAVVSESTSSASFDSSDSVSVSLATDTSSSFDSSDSASVNLATDTSSSTDALIAPNIPLPLPDQNQYNVIIGTSGNDEPLKGGDGQDWIKGGDGIDRLIGREGDDFLDGGKDRDTYITGDGNDIIFFRPGEAAKGTRKIDIVRDFEDGVDRIQLQGIHFSDLNILQGSDALANHTIIRNYSTLEYYLLIQNTNWADITVDDFILDPNMEAIAPTYDWHRDHVSISPFHTRFPLQASNIDNESKIQGLGGASITIGSQRIYTGYRQISSINQDPIIVSFDDTNPENNWIGMDYDVSGADSKGYGLFWSGTDLYAVFSIDGGQDGDFRPASQDAITPWIRSYGVGGGAKVAVIGRLDRSTGELMDAAYLSAVLPNSKSNSVIVEDISTNADGNLLIHTRTASYPRDVKGKPIMDKEGPFDYTVELTPNLKEVISTKVA